ncbi:MAG: transglutaminase domain-containing protein, partial [Methanomicrobiales archaeon]|nr:transglutaminase domain-containing protein [Methanomicrobiales archaeon]
MRARHIPFLMIALLISALLLSGCTSPEEISPPGGADRTLADADTAFDHARYRSAARLYGEAYRGFLADGNAAGARTALNGRMRAERMVLEFPFNLTAIQAAVNETFPDIPAARKAVWLSPGQSQQIVSDGEVLYYENTIANVYFHNPDLMHARNAKEGHTGIYDDVKDLVFAPAMPEEGPYLNPVTWEGTGTLSLPRDLLPENGTLRLWVPLPVETAVQQNVTILAVEPAVYVTVPPMTTGDIGIVYLEIPLEEITTENLTVSTRFRFTQHEQRFAIDPASIGSYNTSDPDYLQFTGSGKNIVITPDMQEKAREIVGPETNPYLQAEKIYWYIVGNFSYSLVPHLMLDTAGIPESSYFLSTGFGDCGIQSMYFSALCRSVGIPARTTGGYQLIPGVAGPHFWAEFYLPDYGWIPVDVTVAETAGWSFDATDEERHRFMAYYFGNLDPYRYVIQKDVDIPLDPDPGDVVLFSAVRQYPAAVCDT